MPDGPEIARRRPGLGHGGLVDELAEPVVRLECAADHACRQGFV